METDGPQHLSGRGKSGSWVTGGRGKSGSWGTGGRGKSGSWGTAGLESLHLSVVILIFLYQLCAGISFLWA